MSLFYIVQWFDKPYGRPFVNTEMRSFEQPLEQTKNWLVEQVSPAGAIVIVYDQGRKIFDLTPLRSHVFLNEAGQKVRGFEENLHAHIEKILKNQGLSLPTNFAWPSKATPVRAKSPKKTKKAKTRQVVDLLASTPSRRAARGKKTVGDVLADIRKRPVGKPCNGAFFAGMQNYATPGALQIIPQRDIDAALKQFSQCNWGDVSASVARANNRYTHNRGGQIHAVYQSHKNGAEFWMIGRPWENIIITLLPSEV